MKTLSAIVTAHMCSADGILACLAGQTVKPLEALVAISSAPSEDALTPPQHTFPVAVTEMANMEDFGYKKRQWLIPQAKGDYCGFFCHDDSYSPFYVQKMLELAEAKDLDVVYCSWNDLPDCTFAPCESTLGNFIVRTSLLQTLGGFPPCRRNEGLRDSYLISLLGMHQPMDGTSSPIQPAVSIGRVNHTLYFHNRPFLPSIRPSVWGRVQGPTAGAPTDTRSGT